MADFDNTTTWSQRHPQKRTLGNRDSDGGMAVTRGDPTRCEGKPNC